MNLFTSCAASMEFALLEFDILMYNNCFLSYFFQAIPFAGFSVAMFLFYSLVPILLQVRVGIFVYVKFFSFQERG